MGGPLGGAAAAFIADKIGVSEKTVEAVSEVLNSGKMSADQIASIKMAEIEFRKFLEQNKLDLEKIAAADRDSARKMQIETRSIVPGVLALLITLGFFGILAWMLAGDYTPTDALLVMLGSLGTAWTSIVAYYYGSSSGSQQKNSILDRMVSK
jgi:hypothetical protein